MAPDGREGRIERGNRRSIFSKFDGYIGRWSVVAICQCLMVFQLHPVRIAIISDPVMMIEREGEREDFLLVFDGDLSLRFCSAFVIDLGLGSIRQYSQ
ncbi:hypothetical protein Nepgr_013783 [Nepenthes gracilis]|uniref:Uncharacterized protein n=1 Tax=Nepenthes gracilis TaxID=150966 RepID=A0AAD3SJV4_NEPGR|nr:hypothetical protein Nepgr_013783 [Nepenthes gracilis]